MIPREILEKAVEFKGRADDAGLLARAIVTAMNFQMRLRYYKRGGHYDCRVFTRTLPTETWALCGNITFDEREWPAALWIFKQGGAQILEDGE